MAKIVDPFGRILGGGMRGIAASSRVVYQYTARRVFGRSVQDVDVEELLLGASEGLQRIHDRSESRFVDSLAFRPKRNRASVIDAEYTVLSDTNEENLDGGQDKGST